MNKYKIENITIVAICLFFQIINAQSHPLNEIKFPMQINAEEAKGGETTTNENGTAIFFPIASPAQEKFFWILKDPIPAGNWQIEIEFYQPSGPFSANQMMYFENADGETITNIDFYYLGLTTGTYTRSFKVCCVDPIKIIGMIKGKQRNSNTAAIKLIKITPTESLDNSSVTLQVSVKNGKLLFPKSFPEGAYVVTTNKPIAITLSSSKGKRFTTPFANETHIYLDQLVQASIESKEAVKSIQMTHYLTKTSPNMTSAGKNAIIQFSDTTKTEIEVLTLIDYAGKEIPTLNLFPNGNTIAIVTGWDDGKEQDTQVANYLKKYGIKGTFFMNRNSTMNSKLDELESKGMEIGSHSWSHPALYNSTPETCINETLEMRRYLEAIVNYPVISFAYPFNYQAAYDANGNYVLRALRTAGYLSGRATTIGDNTIDKIVEPLAMLPNFHFKYGVEKIKLKFEELQKKPGSIMYVWGHSYEIAGDGEKTLEDVLAIISNKPQVWYATLGELMTWQYIRNHLAIESKKVKGKNSNFIFKIPVLHPFWRPSYLSIILPANVKTIIWKGKRIEVADRHIQLPL